VEEIVADGEVNGEDWVASRRRSVSTLAGVTSRKSIEYGND
jgi:hypothetical protein